MSGVIIANGTVLTCDAGNRCGTYHILVRKGRIVDVAEDLDSLRRDHPEASVLDATNKLIVPGFVNAHYHGSSILLQSVGRGLHFNIRKTDISLVQASSKLLLKSNRDDIPKIYEAAFASHLRSGTTCVGEFPDDYDDETFARMLEGVTRWGITTVVALQNWDQIRSAQSIRESGVRPVVSLGKTEEFTVYSFEQLSKVAKELQAPLLAHTAETRDEVEVVRQNFQRDPFTLLNSYNMLRPTTIIVHANYATEDEVEMIQNLSGTVVVCPLSTAVKQTGYPSLRHLAKQSVRLCLGTDWGSTNMMREMQFMLRLPLVVAGIRPFAAGEVLRMATINGAYALGLSSELGSIEEGKRADVVMLDYEKISCPTVPSLSSAEDWARFLIEDLSTADISDVMVNGEFRFRDRSFVAAEEGKILASLRGLHKKYFPSPAISETEDSDIQTNVLPFLPEKNQQEERDFETGFPPRPQPVTIIDINDRTAKKTPNLSKPDREPVKPELPKNTRRVFGEDEDF